MKKAKTNIIKTYDAIANDFDITRYKPWPDTIRFAEKFSPGETILDLGCGNGRDSRFLEEKGMKVAGLDISRGQLDVVRQRSSGTPDILLGDIAWLPFRSGIADGALLVATLHHIPEREERLKALNEVHRCLRPGGLCLLGVWAAEQPKFKDNMAQAKLEFQDQWEPGDILLDWTLPDGRIFKRYYHLFSEEEFDDLLDDSLFTVEERFYSADNHYAVLRKGG